MEKLFDGWLRLSDWTPRASLRWHVVTMAVSIALLFGTISLFNRIPKGFLPSEDQGRFQMSVEAIQGIGFDEMVRHVLMVADVVAKEPDIAGFNSNVGGGPGGGGLNTGRIGIDLKPRNERTKSVDEIIAELRPELA